MCWWASWSLLCFLNSFLEDVPSFLQFFRFFFRWWKLNIQNFRYDDSRAKTETKKGVQMKVAALPRVGVVKLWQHFALSFVTHGRTLTHKHTYTCTCYCLRFTCFNRSNFVSLGVCVHRHKRKTNELLWSIFLPPSEVGYGNFAGLFLLDPVVARALGFRKLHNITVAGRRSWSYCWAKDTRTLTANGGGLARFLCECVREQNERIGCLISHVGVITLSRWWWFKVKYIGLVSLTMAGEEIEEK